MKNLADHIMVLDDVLSPETCATMIDLFETTPADSRFKRTSEFDWGTDHRKFDELNVSLSPEAGWDAVRPVLLRSVVSAYDIYKNATKARFLPSMGQTGLEALRMKKYTANDYDQFGWHADVGDADSAVRSLAMFIYLNDVAEGGETEFGQMLADENQVLTVIPKVGRMVVFPPMWLFPHRGLKPVSGPKYIVSAYTHYV